MDIKHKRLINNIKEHNFKVLSNNIINEFIVYFELKDLNELEPELIELYSNIFKESNNINDLLNNLFNIYDSFFMEDSYTISFNEFIQNINNEFNLDITWRPEQ